ADGQVGLVCQRFDPNQRPGGQFGGGPAPPPPELAVPEKKPGQEPERPRPPRQPVPVQGLEFVGRSEAKGEVTLKLVYPVEARRPRILGRLARTPPPPVWKEMDVVLDFAKAKDVPIPKEAAERKEKLAPNRRESWQPPVRNDLEGLWAVAQVEQFVDLDNEVADFGFYGFAATATGRK